MNKKMASCITFFMPVIIVILSYAVVSAQPQPLKDGQEKFWKLKAKRHGVSYFKITNLKETTPLVEGEWDFQHYHKYDEIVYWMRRWEKEYPDILDVYVGGISFEGREILQATLTNKSTGPDTEKPAMMLDANRHAGEVTAGESVFWQLHHMLVNYGKDEEITRLIDNYAFYFRPRNNPDGSLLYLNTAQSLRSTTRPTDNDGDGLLDEDPGEDLDGDGFIRQMRIKVPKGEGTHVIDSADPKGRLMRRVEDDEEGDYLVMSEGIDNDGDGRTNEDGIGGLDLHRNYPENWRPMPGRDLTGRGWTQTGAGEFPLSEPETRSLVIFLLEHPNIGVVNSMDTSVPMHLRGPSTSKSEERMYPEDLELLKYFDEKGMEITGYAWAGDTYYDYATRGSRTTGNPLFGHGPDFGYWYYGAIWYGDELWDRGTVGDYNGNGKENEQIDKLIYNDTVLSKSRFQEWTPVKHPEYDEVEVGGWNPKFWNQNPPPELLEEWAEKEARFNLMLASHMPDVIIHDPKVTPEGDGVYLVEVEVENRGFLPTALKQAQLVKIVRPDMIHIDFPEGMLPPRRTGFGRFGGFGGGQAQPQKKDEDFKVQMLEPQQPSIDIDRLEGNSSKTVTFRFKLNDISQTTATIRFSSTRGGVKTKEITIGGGN